MSSDDIRIAWNEADTMTAWWLCPNEPRCPHGAVIHDVYELGDTPRCCVEGCDCGKREMARGLSRVAARPGDCGEGTRRPLDRVDCTAYREVKGASHPSERIRT